MVLFQENESFPIECFCMQWAKYLIYHAIWTGLGVTSQTRKCGAFIASYNQPNKSCVRTTLTCDIYTNNAGQYHNLSWRYGKNYVISSATRMT